MNKNNTLLTNILETVQGIRRDNRMSDVVKYLAIAGIGATVAAAGLYIKYGWAQSQRVYAGSPQWSTPSVQTDVYKNRANRIFAGNPNKEVPILGSPPHVNIDELREKIKEIHQIAKKL